MPILLVMIILLAVRVLFLPGASQGVSFLFRPDFSKITGQSLLAAMGQAFFSLSLGMGCIITYASHVKKEDSIVKLGTYSSAADLGFALLAGLAIMPAVFAFGISPSEGPSLVFVTLPLIFAQLPLGNSLLLSFCKPAYCRRYRFYFAHRSRYRLFYRRTQTIAPTLCVHNLRSGGGDRKSKRPLFWRFKGPKNFWDDDVYP